MSALTQHARKFPHARASTLIALAKQEQKHAQLRKEVDQRKLYRRLLALVWRG